MVTKEYSKYSILLMKVISSIRKILHRISGKNSLLKFPDFKNTVFRKSIV